MEENAKLYLTIVEDLKKNNKLDVDLTINDININKDNKNIGNINPDIIIDTTLKVKESNKSKQWSFFSIIFIILIIILVFAAVISFRRIYKKSIKNKLDTHEKHDKV